MSFCFEIYDVPPPEAEQSNKPSIVTTSGYLAAANFLELAQAEFEAVYGLGDPASVARSFSQLSWAVDVSARSSGPQQPRSVRTDSLVAITTEALLANNNLNRTRFDLTISPALRDITSIDMDGYRPVLGNAHGGLPSIRSRSKVLQEYTAMQLIGVARRYGKESAELLRGASKNSSHVPDASAVRARLLGATLANTLLVTLGAMQRYHPDTINEATSMATKLIQSFRPPSSAAPDA